MSGEDSIVSSRMDTKTLFLETVEDLRRRSSNARSEYEAVISALLLRKLLLDSPTLIDVANQEPRIKITYVVDARPPIWKQLGEEPPVAYSEEDGFDPESGLISPMPVEMKRDELLSQVVMVYRGHELSVRDLIDYVAHVAGAFISRRRKPRNRLPRRPWLNRWLSGAIRREPGRCSQSAG